MRSAGDREIAASSDGAESWTPGEYGRQRVQLHANSDPLATSALAGALEHQSVVFGSSEDQALGPLVIVLKRARIGRGLQ